MMQKIKLIYSLFIPLLLLAPNTKAKNDFAYPKPSAKLKPTKTKKNKLGSKKSINFMLFCGGAIAVGGAITLYYLKKTSQYSESPYDKISERVKTYIQIIESSNGEINKNQVEKWFKKLTDVENLVFLREMSRRNFVLKYTSIASFFYKRYRANNNPNTVINLLLDERSSDSRIGEHGIYFHSTRTIESLIKIINDGQINASRGKPGHNKQKPGAFVSTRPELQYGVQGIGLKRSVETGSLPVTTVNKSNKAKSNKAIWIGLHDHIKVNKYTVACMYVNSDKDRKKLRKAISQTALSNKKIVLHKDIVCVDAKRVVIPWFWEYNVHKVSKINEEGNLEVDDRWGYNTY